jgi:hypothetical protein
MTVMSAQVRRREAHKILGRSVMGHVGPLSDIWWNLNFNQTNNTDLKKNINNFWISFSFFTYFSRGFFKNSNLWTVIGPIWTYFTKFKIKCMKRSNFEIKFPPDLLEFRLGVLVNFLIFYKMWKISKSKQWFGGLCVRTRANAPYFTEFPQNRPTFVTRATETNPLTE